MPRVVFNPFTGQLQFLPHNTLQRVTVDLTVAGDTTIYTQPAAPAGNGRFILTRCILRLNVALVGAGNATVRIGSTLGGNEIILDQVINAATVTGVIAGEDTASLGADMLPTQAYEAIYNAGQLIRLRNTIVAPVTAGELVAYVYGEILS